MVKFRVWRHRKHVNQVMILGLFSVATLFFCFPLLKTGRLYLGDDLAFHLQRLVGLDNVWTSPINFLGYMGHGAAVNTFYPWLLYYPAYLFGLLFGNMLTGYKCFLVVMTLLCLSLSYWTGHRLSSNRFRGICFALLYTFSAYRASDVFLRAAVGEIIAFSLMPLVLLGLWEVLVGDKQHWPILALGISGLVYAHLLSAILATLMCAVIAGMYLIVEKKRAAKIISIIKAAGVCVLLSLGFIVPFLRQIRAEGVTSPGNTTIVGTAPSSLFDALLDNNWLKYSLGITCLIAVALIVKYCREFSVFEWCLTIADGLFFIGTTSLVPMQLIDNTPLQEIQFLFRLNMIVTLLTLYLATSHLKLPQLGQQVGMVFVLLLSLTVLHYQGYEQMTHNNPQLHAPVPDRMYTYAELTHNIMKHRYIREYRPVSAGVGYALPKYYQIKFNGVKVAHTVQRTSGIYTLKLKRPAKQAGWLRTSAFHYLDADVKVDGKKAQRVSATHGFVKVHMLKNQQTITVQYHYPLVVTLARILSMLSLIGCGWWLRPHRK